MNVCVLATQSERPLAKNRSGHDPDKTGCDHAQGLLQPICWVILRQKILIVGPVVGANFTIAISHVAILCLTHRGSSGR